MSRVVVVIGLNPISSAVARIHGVMLDKSALLAAAPNPQSVKLEYQQLISWVVVQASMRKITKSFASEKCCTNCKRSEKGLCPALFQGLWWVTLKSCAEAHCIQQELWGPCGWLVPRCPRGAAKLPFSPRGSLLDESRCALKQKPSLP